MSERFGSQIDNSEHESVLPTKKQDAFDSEKTNKLRESRESRELEDTVFEALESLKVQQPDYDFGKLYTQLCPIDESKSDPKLMSQFLDFAWDLDVLSEDDTLFNGHGLEEMDRLIEESKTSELIERMDQNLKVITYLEKELNAPVEVIRQAKNAARNIQVVKVNLRDLGRTEMGILSINGKYQTSWKVGELEPTKDDSNQISPSKTLEKEELMSIAKKLRENIGENKPFSNTEMMESKALVEHILNTDTSFASLRESWLDNENDFLLGRMQSFEMEDGQTEFITDDERLQLDQMDDKEAQEYFMEVYFPRVAAEHPDLIRSMVTSG